MSNAKLISISMDKYKRLEAMEARVAELEAERDALLDLRADMRELAEREEGLFRHFYERPCAALEGK